jgi:hypothetical protein
MHSTRVFYIHNSLPGEIIETHGPYQHGSGFKTVNAPDPALQPFPANIPPSTSNESIGSSFPGHFASEFGCRCECRRVPLRAIVHVTRYFLQCDVVFRKHGANVEAF